MTAADEWLLDDDWWRRIRGPIEQARGLPNSFYWSESLLQRERAHLFSRTWCFAGRASSVAAPGDARPVEVAGHPLILLRDKQGGIRVFHNVCPHRGARVLTQSCQSKSSLICPYHAWTYELDGRLKSRPHYDGPGRHDAVGANGENPVGLFEVRAEVWFDWVFVDLSGQCAPFSEQMQPVLHRLADFPLDEFSHYRTLRFEFNANWKLVAENFFDVYHVFRVHPDLNRIYGGPRTSNQTDGVLMFNEYFAPPDDRGGGLPEPDNLPDTWSQRVFFGNLFPNLGISAYPSSVYLAEFIPLAPDRTAMEMHFYFSGGRDAAADVAAGREQVLQWWTELNAEDEGVCELLQLGRKSPAYPGGRLAPHWDRATQYFARLIAESLQ